MKFSFFFQSLAYQKQQKGSFDKKLMKAKKNAFVLEKKKNGLPKETKWK